MNLDKLAKTNELYNKIAALIELSRQKVVVSVNVAIVYTNYEIGKYIVEDEQQGEKRAGYGKSILKDLSARLTEEYGKGYSLENLKLFRKFYQMYKSKRVNSVYPIQSDTLEPLSKFNQLSDLQLNTSFTLSWSHYIVLMRVENPDARRFYEIESAEQQWSVRHLARQCASSLYERLALSRNKNDVMRLAVEGQTITKPSDILKNPVTLEFLGLEPQASYTETELEQRIIDNLQKFLLEMGKGFLFEARQKRFQFDEDNYFLDLVLYNRLLQCFVLIDLKTDKLQHKDLGQMQMYVNYYDRHVKQNFEKPTVGILLCETANQSLVELTLPVNANIYAAQYSLYLPDKAVLQQKLKEWITEYEEEQATENFVVR
jgi:predicted nuclease of restriction endonuclease-like (RecB) superfamily